MIFQIYWSDNFDDHIGWILFDVEVWKDNGGRSTELRVRTFSEGITRLIISQIRKETFDVEEFVAHSGEIEDLRNWVWIVTERGIINGANAHEEKVRHIKSVLKTFASKYGCYVNID